MIVFGISADAVRNQLRNWPQLFTSNPGGFEALHSRYRAPFILLFWVAFLVGTLPLLLIIGMVAYLTIATPFVSDFTGSLEFHSAEWINNKELEVDGIMFPIRCGQIDDLVENVLTRGSPEPDIVELLGPPDWKPDQRTLMYNLGNCDFWEHTVLEVTLNKDGKLKKAKSYYR